MSNDEGFELEGVVKEILPGSRFLVSLTTEDMEGHEVSALVSGNMRKHFIKIVPGDRVRLKVSSYDHELENCLITYRYK